MRTNALPASALTLLVTALATALFAASPVLAQDDARTKSGTTALAADGTVYVENHEGRIQITTWDRNEVKYTAEVERSGDEEEAMRTTVDVSSTSSRFEIRTTFDDSNSGGWGWNESADVMPVYYVLTVPRSARVSIEDHESEMSVDGLQAELRIDTHEGPITVRNHQGPLEIDAHDSPITLADVQGEVEIDTHDGDIEITGLDGELEIDNHDARVDVRFAALTSDVEVETHDGRTTLRLPANAGFRLDAELGEDGRISGDFDVSSLRDDDNDYRGDVNGGGPRIQLSAHDGSFRLLKQEGQEQ